MKECSKCKVEKDVGEFVKEKTRKDGLQCWCRSCCKQYRQSNKQNLNKQKREYYQTAKGRFRNIRSGAKYRGISFDFTFEQYEADFYKKECFYCGTEAVGVDRINSNLGYEKNNILPCCGTCNQAKNILSYEQFIDLCSTIVARHLK